MSFNTDLKMAYHMGYDDALAKRKPDASKVQVLAPYDLATKNVKLQELLQASLRDFRRIYDYDEQDGWQMVDAIDRMVIGMRKLGLDAGCTEQELRVEVGE